MYYRTRLIIGHLREHLPKSHKYEKIADRTLTLTEIKSKQLNNRVLCRKSEYLAPQKIPLTCSDNDSCFSDHFFPLRTKNKFEKRTQNWKDSLEKSITTKLVLHLVSHESNGAVFIRYTAGLIPRLLVSPWSIIGQPAEVVQEDLRAHSVGGKIDWGFPVSIVFFCV